MNVIFCQKRSSWNLKLVCIYQCIHLTSEPVSGREALCVAGPKQKLLMLRATASGPRFCRHFHRRWFLSAQMLYAMLVFWSVHLSDIFLGPQINICFSTSTLMLSVQFDRITSNRNKKKNIISDTWKWLPLGNVVITLSLSIILKLKRVSVIQYYHAWLFAKRKCRKL